jgi:hypothetical protein
MKTSNKLLLAALLVLLTSLTAYNMALRNEYSKGDYKDPLHGYASLGFKDFTEIDLSAAGSARVKVVAGPFGVRLSPRAAELVKVSQQGNRLVVQVDFKKPNQYLGWGQTLVISCPRLAQLTSGTAYRVAGALQPKSKNMNSEVQVQGFQQDSLRVRLDQASNVTLNGNKLRYLAAVAGATPGSTANLALMPTNHIGAANLDMQHQSELIINDINIPQLKCHFADSTKATLTGAALSSLAR